MQGVCFVGWEFLPCLAQFSLVSIKIPSRIRDHGVATGIWNGIQKDFAACHQYMMSVETCWCHIVHVLKLECSQLGGTMESRLEVRRMRQKERRRELHQHPHPHQHLQRLRRLQRLSQLMQLRHQQLNQQLKQLNSLSGLSGVVAWVNGALQI